MGDGNREFRVVGFENKFEVVERAKEGRNMEQGVLCLWYGRVFDRPWGGRKWRVNGECARVEAEDRWKVYSIGGERFLGTCQIKDIDNVTEIRCS